MAIARNAAYLFSMQVVVTLIGLIFMPYVTRVLGSEALGVHSFGVSVADLCAVMGFSVVQILGVRRVAQSRDNPGQLQREFSLALTYQWIFIALGGVVFMVWTLLQGDGFGGHYRMLLVYMLANAMDVSWFFSGVERFHHVSIRTVITRASMLLVTVLFVPSRDWLWLYMLLHGCTLLLSNGVLWFGLKRYGVRMQLVNPRAVLREWLPAALAVLLPAVFTLMISTVDHVLLGYLSTKREVALYDFPLRLEKVGTMVVGVVANVMYPRLSYLWGSGRHEEFRAHASRQLFYTLAAGTLFGGGYMAINQEVTSILLGDDFQGSSLVLLTMGFALPLSGSGLYQMCLSVGRERRVVWGLLVAVLIIALGDFVTIPKYGAVGAAWVFVLATWQLQLYYLWLVKDAVSPWRVLRLLSGMLLCAGLAWLGVHWVEAGGEVLRFVVKGALFILIYMVSLYLFVGQARVELRYVIARGREWLAAR